MQTFKLALISLIFFLLAHWSKNRPAFNSAIVHLYSCLIKCHVYQFYLSYLSIMSSRYIRHISNCSQRRRRTVSNNIQMLPEQCTSRMTLEQIQTTSSCECCILLFMRVNSNLPISGTQV